ncbi:hypothetical protein [Cryptosporangium japonicum]|uniref:Membrane transporter protein n=1 Tax=Cryptosporangium japonicum TaxID=80872 RepID=A0ABP3DUJ0_9ACTN
MTDWAVLAGLTAVVAAGAYAQASIGFGLNLLLVPFALLLAPPLVPLPALVVNGAVSAVAAGRWSRPAAPCSPCSRRPAAR